MQPQAIECESIVKSKQSQCHWSSANSKCLQNAPFSGVDCYLIVYKQIMGSTFFERSASFGGSKPGWYFGSGPQGLGYYLDENAPTISDGSMHRSKRLKGSELLELVEKGAGGVKEIDEKGLQRLLNTLEKKFNVNVEQRVKYADDPKKFMESEVELDEAVKALRVCLIGGLLCFC